MEIYAAPLQGYTTALWRHHHATLCPGVDRYFTPFVRVEKGAPRQHDMRDVTSPLNANHKPVAQMIFKDVDEFIMLADAFAATSQTEVDLNLGCPFPPQMNKGRGAAMVGNAAVLSAVSEAMSRYPDMHFSLKMRLGREQADEWRNTIDIINAMPLTHVTVHPRIGRQQYRGDLDMTEFAALKQACTHPIIFNGDIATPDDVWRLSDSFPDLKGIMIGRGLLARPTLAREIKEQREMPIAEQIDALRQLHDLILADYEQTLCGEAQILMKIRSFWDYCDNILPHRTLKAIRKSQTLAKYRIAVCE